MSNLTLKGKKRKINNQGRLVSNPTWLTAGYVIRRYGRNFFSKIDSRHTFRNGKRLYIKLQIVEDTYQKFVIEAAQALTESLNSIVNREGFMRRYLAVKAKVDPAPEFMRADRESTDYTFPEIHVLKVRLPKIDTP